MTLRHQQAVQLQILQQIEAFVQSNVAHPLASALGHERADSPKVQPADTTNHEEDAEETERREDQEEQRHPQVDSDADDKDERSTSPRGPPREAGGPRGDKPVDPLSALGALCAPLPPDAAPETTPNQPNTLELLQKHTEKALQNTMSGGSFLLNGLGAFPDEANGDGKKGDGKDNYFRFVVFDFREIPSTLRIMVMQKMSDFTCCVCCAGTDAVFVAKSLAQIPRFKSISGHTPARDPSSATCVETDSPPREILRCTSSGTRPSIRMLR